MTGPAAAPDRQPLADRIPSPGDIIGPFIAALPQIITGLPGMAGEITSAIADVLPGGRKQAGREAGA